MSRIDRIRFSGRPSGTGNGGAQALNAQVQGANSIFQDLTWFEASPASLATRMDPFRRMDPSSSGTQ